MSSQAFDITEETNTEGGFCLKALSVYLERPKKCGVVDSTSKSLGKRKLMESVKWYEASSWKSKG